jgi:glycerol uptake facilitator-like aquaporin
MVQPHLTRRLVAEALGTALLLAVIVGSGIMAERLADGNAAIALLANTIATGGGLLALILAFGPISGAHFNPLVTLVEALGGALPWRLVLPYVIAQVAGGGLGVLAAHGMFELPTLGWSQHARSGLGQGLSEFIATFGLIAVVVSCNRHRPASTPVAVATYITAAYWFTASTSFANPAVTIARACSDTFAGIRPLDVPGFIAAQTLGALTAAGLFRWLLAAAPVPAPASLAPAITSTARAESP